VAGIDGACVAAGHSVWGMLNAPATGEAMSELILDGAAHRVDLALFAPGRLPPLDPARGVAGCANAPAPVSIATRTLRRVCPRGSRIAGPQNRPALWPVA
jgi:hypothetical protein